MPRPIITSDNVILWLTSKEPMMEEMAKSFIGEPLLEEEEMVEILAFFGIFALGCKQIGLTNLAEKFNKRADLFAAGLVPLGFSKTDYKQLVLDRTLHGSAKRIQNRACSRVAYVMCELKREEEIQDGPIIPKEEKKKE